MKLRVLAIAAFFFAASTATAGSGHKHGFSKYDHNADGVITLDELGEHKAEKFAKLDSDGNGEISEAEYNEYKAMKKKKRDEA